MNFQAAAIVAAVAFVLSVLAGLVGGVALFDIVLRALFWAAFGLGASLGVEALVRTFLPELLDARDAEPAMPESAPKVNIVVEEELPRGFEAESGGEPGSRAEVRRAPQRPEEGASDADQTPEGEQMSETDQMPEIGSFLDSFKPGAAEPDSSEGSGPLLGDSVPEFSSSPGEVTIDGEHQDPALMARAVQTVMKRDGQGN